MKKIFALLILAAMLSGLIACDIPQQGGEQTDIPKDYVADPAGYVCSIICDTGADVTLVPWQGR